MVGASTESDEIVPVLEFYGDCIAKRVSKQDGCEYPII